jgi:hypothetical protein
MSGLNELVGGKWAGNINMVAIERKQAFSTTAPLGANAVYTSPTIDVINYKVINGLVLSDVAGTFQLQYSDDGIVWINVGGSTSITANTPSLITSQPAIRYARYIFTNGAVAQISFRFSVYLSPL